MTVTLSPDLEELVSGEIAFGAYPDPAAVVSEALRLLRERNEARREKLEFLRREIQRGIDSADRGEVRPFTQEVVDEIMGRVAAARGVKEVDDE